MMKSLLLLSILLLSSAPVTIEGAALRRARAQRPSDVRVNINTATTEALTRLPGVGPALAERIVEHRQRNGLFKRLPELIAVRGMSEKLFRQIAPLVRI